MGKFLADFLKIVGNERGVVDPFSWGALGKMAAVSLGTGTCHCRISKKRATKGPDPPGGNAKECR